MAKNDIVTRLRADNSDLQRKLADAQKQIRRFKSSSESLSAGVTSAFKKMGSATAAVAGAIKTMDAVIQSSQTTADGFGNSIAAARTEISSMFAAISAGDFSSFIRGMKESAAAAMEAASWTDQLGNTTMSFGYFNTRNIADLREQMSIIDKNSGATDEERAAARTRAQEIITEMKREIETFGSVTLKSAFADVSANAYGLLNPEELSLGEIENVLKIDITSDFAEQRSKYTEQYRQFQEQLKAINDKYGRHVRPGQFTTVDYGDPEALRQAKSELVSMYKETLIYYSLLEKMSDDQLQQFINKLNSVDQAEKTLYQTQRRLNSLMSETADSTAAAVARIPSPNLDRLIPSGFSQLYVDSAAVAKHASPNIELPAAGLKEYRSSLTDTSGAISSVAGAIESMNSALGGSSESWVSFAAKMLQAVAIAIPAITSLTAAYSAEASSASAAAVAGSTAAGAALGPAGAIAAAATVAAALVAAIASIPKYAGGGVVGGSAMTGDNILARVNSGEVILNDRQQTILSERLEGMSGNVRFVIEGQNLVGILNNYNRTSGRRIN